MAEQNLSGDGIWDRISQSLDASGFEDEGLDGTLSYLGEVEM